MSVFTVVVSRRALGAGMLWILSCAIPATAAETLPLNAAQKRNLGIVVAPAVPRASSSTPAYPARVALSPAGVRVVAAAGAALVVQLHVQAGDAVRQGAPLVSLSMPGLAEAQAALVQARVRAQLAADNAARDEKLFAEGLIAESRLRAARAETQSAQANRAAAQTARTLLGQGTVSGSTLTLTAPMAGTVIESPVEPGQRVDAGMPLLKLADLSRLTLDIPLSPAEAQGVTVGMDVHLTDSTASGRVTAVLPQLDAAQSVRVRASLVDPQHRLRPGQSVRATLAGRTAGQTQAVPAGALVWKLDVPYVFVETAQGFAPTRVTLVRQNAREAEIGGLAAGSRVAVAGVAALKAQWLSE